MNHLSKKMENVNMKNLLVVFSHGKESGPYGSKIQALTNVVERLGGKTISVDYREYPVGTAHDQNAEGEADRRVGQLLEVELPAHHQLVLVGSSMGGYVSTVATWHLKVHGLFLMAPAFYLPGYANQDPSPRTSNTMIIHGWNDSVVPPKNSIRFAKLCQCDLHLMDGEHNLNKYELRKIVPLFELFLEQIIVVHPDEKWQNKNIPSKDDLLVWAQIASDFDKVQLSKNPNKLKHVIPYFVGRLGPESYEFAWKAESIGSDGNRTDSIYSIFTKQNGVWVSCGITAMNECNISLVSSRNATGFLTCAIVGSVSKFVPDTRID
jgi:alpha/beta superfamily hydrolase